MPQRPPPGRRGHGRWAARDRRFHPALKLFYESDVNLMRPREVLRLEPVPRVINYQ